MEKGKDLKQLPLHGVLVLEFCQYLSGPSVGLRLADLGARIIKIENPGKGDLCRILPIKDQWIGDNSLLFHTINRNKESYTANLKSGAELVQVKKLIANADVLVHNFRPGVMEKLGLGFEELKQINPQIIYAGISGYGMQGPWSKKAGQDLLLQAISGLMYASGNQKDAPTPFGISIGDILCGAQLVQAILAALLFRKKSGKGTFLEISLLESLIDFQFEIFTTYFAMGKRALRSAVNNAHPLLGAPYGIFKTQDGYIAIAMVPIKELAEALECDGLRVYDQSMVFLKRDDIKTVLFDFMKGKRTEYWLKKLKSKKLWALDLKNWKELRELAGYREAKLEQDIVFPEAKTIKTTRCPIRIDGERLLSPKPAPRLGTDTERIKKEFNLTEIG